MLMGLYSAGSLTLHGDGREHEGVGRDKNDKSRYGAHAPVPDPAKASVSQKLSDFLKQCFHGAILPAVLSLTAASAVRQTVPALAKTIHRIYTIYASLYKVFRPDMVKFQAYQRKNDSCENSPIICMTFL